MDDPVFKQKYQKYKLRVKLWEKDFRKKHGRIPSKYDIREASQVIRDSYKMYYKLKTSFLEDTLNDVLSDDGFDILDISPREGDMDTSLSEIVNKGPQLPLDITKLVEQHKDHDTTAHENYNNISNSLELPCSFAFKNMAGKNEDTVLKEFEAVEVLSLNAKSWGSDVSTKIQAKETTDFKNKIVKTNLKEKLFQNSSFSKRNPRKSLSKSLSKNSLSGSQSNTSEDLNTSIKEVLPDLETILLQKAKEQQTAAVIPSNPLLAVEKAKENIKTQVDIEWLERNAAQTDLKNEPNSSNSVEEINIWSSTKSRKKSVYGLTNFDASKLKAATVPKIEQIAVKNRCVPNSKPNLNFEVESSEQLNFKEMHLKELKKFQTNSKPNESDSMVDDSEEEIGSQDYRHIVKRKRIACNLLDEIEISHPDKSYAQSRVENSIRREIVRDDCLVDTAEETENIKTNKGKRKSLSKNTAKLVGYTKVIKKASAKEKIKTSSKEIKNKAKNRASKRKAVICEELSEEEFQGKPFDTDDLKYALALERGDLTSVPRLEQSALDNAEKLAEKYICSAPSVPGRASSRLMSVRAVDEKRAVARRKLEEKIATGKLNENFVTINIQKKTFVRGKKTVNYSKYKKKLWKHKKKIAALTGPNMDMGGCDGGVLKCFNCGNVGHFAQNCKIKGDSLLPLTVQLAEDASPFPTLEEAKHMASQSAVAVHSRNIAKMPQAPNAALYKSVTEDHKVKVNTSKNLTDTKSDDESLPKEEILMQTDDELENFDVESAILQRQNTVSPIKKYVGSKIPEEFLKAAGFDPTNLNWNHTNQFGAVGPLYDTNADGSVKEVTPEVLKVLKMFGHTNFRKGQDRAVMRILSGVSTLVTLSTGSGKSLCYQLPAYLYSKHKKSITLVISPLVSLMEDQVTGVPHFLRAHCLHTNQTPQQKIKIMKMISDGEIDILLVSPEAVVAGERSTGFGSILRQLPPIAFACIDEVHCVSQWSHNFRPSYLMICKVLRQNLGVKCVLGLTATATLPTRMSIITHLDIMDGERGIISDIPLPDNLIISVSKDENRDSALLRLLLSRRFEACQSIVIYCTRRDECERIAGYLRTCLQDSHSSKKENDRKKRKRVNWHAEPYHAGMPASRRRTIQNAFMMNELRIVVATIAFGMGINKPDIRAVIHYNMPRNFESYVQEVGRAGRDNKVSHCHLFLDSNGGDQNELKRHIYANSLDRHVIRKLLQHIFVPCSCDKILKDGVLLSSAFSNETSVKKNYSDASVYGEQRSNTRLRVCQGHEIGFSIEETIQALDIPEENISTLLCYIELENRWCINVLSNAYIQAKIISYGGPKYLKHAAKECPPLAMAIALEIKNGSFKDDSNIIQFSVIDVAAAIGWNSGVVKYQLKNLEWLQVNGYPKRSPITVSFFDLGFRIKAPGNFTAEEIDDALDTLYNRSVKQEHSQLIQLQYIFQGLSSVAYNSCDPCCNETFSHHRSDQLKGIIRDYFHNDYPKHLKLEIDPLSVSDGELESDVVNLINIYPENNFSGRAIARIFHGISSPNYPAVIWHRCKYWRFHSKIDFNRIVHLANNVIFRRRT